MADGGFLAPPADNQKGSEIWNETWKRVDRFLPDLFAEIFPKYNPPPATIAEVNAEETSADPKAQSDLSTEVPPAFFDPPEPLLEKPPNPDEPSEQDVD